MMTLVQRLGTTMLATPGDSVCASERMARKVDGIAQTLL
jgi:hypothetical protein